MGAAFFVGSPLGETNKVTLSLGKPQSGDASAAESAAVSPDNRLIAPDLEVVIAAWPTLSEAVKADILAMAKTGTSSKRS